MTPKRVVESIVSLFSDCIFDTFASFSIPFFVLAGACVFKL